MSFKSPGESLAETVRRYTAHNDRREAQLVAEGVLPKRDSLPPPAANLSGQISSIIAAAERRMPKMGREAQDEVYLILDQLKHLTP